MFQRVAEYLRKIVSPISRVLGDISMAVIVVLMLLVVVDVCLRRFFNSPIRGSHDLSGLGFSIVVFLPMAWCALKEGHVDLNILVSRFPKSARLGIEVIILFITTGTLGVTSWQLLMQGIRLQNMNAETPILGIPFSPFLYLATLGTLMMTLVFLIKFFHSLSTLLEKE